MCCLFYVCLMLCVFRCDCVVLFVLELSDFVVWLFCVCLGCVVFASIVLRRLCLSHVLRIDVAVFECFFVWWSFAIFVVGFFVMFIYSVVFCIEFVLAIAFMFLR